MCIRVKLKNGNETSAVPLKPSRCFHEATTRTFLLIDVTPPVMPDG